VEEQAGLSKMKVDTVTIHDDEEKIKTVRSDCLKEVIYVFRRSNSQRLPKRLMFPAKHCLVVNA
jgi:hypothetical protein